MAPHRRDFLKLAACLPMIVSASAGTGPVVFCRVEHRTVREACVWIHNATGAGAPVDIQGPTLRYRDFVVHFQAADEPRLVLCGTEATVMIDSGGTRRFA